MRLFGRLKRRNHGELVAKYICTVFDVKLRADSSVIRILIDATSDADLKMKSRWALALKLLDREKVAWQHTEKYLRRWGGIAGCAEMYATWGAGRKQGRTRRFGGDGRLIFEEGGD